MPDEQCLTTAPSARALHSGSQEIAEGLQIRLPEDSNAILLRVFEILQLEDACEHGSRDTPATECFSPTPGLPTNLAVQALDAIRAAVADFTFSQEEPPVTETDRHVTRAPHDQGPTTEFPRRKATRDANWTPCDGYKAKLG